MVAIFSNISQHLAPVTAQPITSLPFCSTNQQGTIWVGSIYSLLQKGKQVNISCLTDSGFYGEKRRRGRKGGTVAVNSRGEGERVSAVTDKSLLLKKAPAATEAIITAQHQLKL